MCREGEGTATRPPPRRASPQPLPAVKPPPRRAALTPPPLRRAALTPLPPSRDVTQRPRRGTRARAPQFGLASASRTPWCTTTTTTALAASLTAAASRLPSSGTPRRPRPPPLRAAETRQRPKLARQQLSALHRERARRRQLPAEHRPQRQRRLRARRPTTTSFPRTATAPPSACATAGLAAVV